MEAQKWTLRFLLSIKEETTLGRTHTGITLDTTFACLLEQCTFSYPVSVSNVNASSLEGVCVCIRINHQWWNSEQKKNTILTPSRRWFSWRTTSKHPNVPTSVYKCSFCSYSSFMQQTSCFRCLECHRYGLRRMLFSSFTSLHKWSGITCLRAERTEFAGRLNTALIPSIEQIKTSQLSLSKRLALSIVQWIFLNYNHVSVNRWEPLICTFLPTTRVIVMIQFSK